MTHNKFFALMGIGLTGILLSTTSVSANGRYDRHAHHEYKHHDGKHSHKKIIVKSDHRYYGGHRSVWIKTGPQRSYWGRPYVGAFVLSIPFESRPIVIRNKTYYIYDDVYYVRTGDGYEVVDSPVKETIIVKESTRDEVKPDTAPVEITSTKGNESLVKVPNSNGSYFMVKIKKTDKGYVGENGEIYAEFPTGDQLTKMYSK